MRHEGGLLTVIYLFLEGTSCALEPALMTFRGQRCADEAGDDDDGVSCAAAIDRAECGPLIWANSTLVLHLAWCASFSLVIVADAGCGAHELMLGLAPPHVRAGVALELSSSVLVLVMFAGREFAGAAQMGLYTVLYGATLALWGALAILAPLGHVRWRRSHCLESPLPNSGEGGRGGGGGGDGAPEVEGGRGASAAASPSSSSSGRVRLHGGHAAGGSGAANEAAAKERRACDYERDPTGGVGGGASMITTLV